MHEVALPIGRVSHPLLSFCPTLPLPICNGHMPCNPMGSCATPTGATSPALVHLAARARGWSQALLAKKKNGWVVPYAEPFLGLPRCGRTQTFWPGWAGLFAPCCARCAERCIGLLSFAFPSIDFVFNCFMYYFCFSTCKS